MFRPHLEYAAEKENTGKVTTAVGDAGVAHPDVFLLGEEVNETRERTDREVRRVVALYRESKKMIAEELSVRIDSIPVAVGVANGRRAGADDITTPAWADRGKPHARS